MWSGFEFSVCDVSCCDLWFEFSVCDVSWCDLGSSSQFVIKDILVVIHVECHNRTDLWRTLDVAIIAHPALDILNILPMFPYWTAIFITITATAGPPAPWRRSRRTTEMSCTIFVSVFSVRHRSYIQINWPDECYEITYHQPGTLSCSSSSGSLLSLCTRMTGHATQGRTNNDTN